MVTDVMLFKSFPWLPSSEWVLYRPSGRLSRCHLRQQLRSIGDGVQVQVSRFVGHDVDIFHSFTSLHISKGFETPRCLSRTARSAPTLLPETNTRTRTFSITASPFCVNNAPPRLDVRSDVITQAQSQSSKTVSFIQELVPRHEQP